MEPKKQQELKGRIDLIGRLSRDDQAYALLYREKLCRQMERRQWLPDIQQGAATEFQRKMGLTLSGDEMGILILIDLLPSHLSCRHFRSIFSSLSQKVLYHNKLYGSE